MDGAGGGEAADAARLDVDDAPAAELEHVVDAVEARDRFVQAHRGGQPALQGGVAHEVVAAQGLLDHHQPEAVERGEVVEVGRRVGAVGVGHQRRPAAHRLAHRGQVRHVGARLHLDLRLAVALGEGAAHHVDQPLRVVLDADGDARRDPRARAPEKGGQADPRALGREHPHPHLDRRLRHVVAAHRRLEPRMQGLGAVERLAEGQRGDPLPDGEPRGVDGLGREVGALAGHALRPRRRPVDVAGLEEEDAPEVGGAGRDAERLDEGHPDLAQGDGLQSDAHAGVTVLASLAWSWHGSGGLPGAHASAAVFTR